KIDRAFAVDRVTQRIDHAANHPRPDWHGRDTTQGANFIAFLNFVVFTQDNDTDIILFEVEGHAQHAVTELNQFAEVDVIHTQHTGDTVADFVDITDFNGF